MSLWNFRNGPGRRKRVFGRRVNFNLGFLLMALSVLGLIVVMLTK